MNREHLRLHNLVAASHAPGYVYRIIEFNDDSVTLHPRAGFPIVVSYDELQPLPITTEYLLAAGFVREPETFDPYWYTHLINQKEKVSVVDLAGPHFDIIRLEKGEILSNGQLGDPNKFHGVDHRKLYHVHQLQNISEDLGYSIEFDWEN